jgi:hypothetical protein
METRKRIPVMRGRERMKARGSCLFVRLISLVRTVLAYFTSTLFRFIIYFFVVLHTRSVLNE